MNATLASTKTPEEVKTSRLQSEVGSLEKKVDKRNEVIERTAFLVREMIEFPSSSERWKKAWWELSALYCPTSHHPLKGNLHDVQNTGL
jgi:hypothetical protein